MRASAKTGYVSVSPSPPPSPDVNPRSLPADEPLCSYHVFWYKRSAAKMLKRNSGGASVDLGEIANIHSDK
ncbi:hypothetical protein CHS0354_037496 [Potamilus streckersoni]|uniref:Uncharacterized protein n=1 Tax=Potamilus streckersoni TaxID=2493646 RepID=A0AAE0RPJ7_9BIVA|nr:hypothetical protein CHS0354_037496 [Potamilus streckersoni]